MCRSLVVWCGLMCLLGSAFAQDPIPREIVDDATTAYLQGDYDQAFRVLSHIPGLLGVVPMLDRPERSARAEVFFDLGRIQIAKGDSAKARLALVEAFGLDPAASNGVMDLAPDRALESTNQVLSALRKTHRRQTLQKTTFWGAAGRSLLFPGWGQIYRGRKKRGYTFMGVSAALAAVWLSLIALIEVLTMRISRQG